MRATRRLERRRSLPLVGGGEAGRRAAVIPYRDGAREAAGAHAGPTAERAHLGHGSVRLRVYLLPPVAA